MPGLYKMNSLGLCFLKDQFIKDPSISYSDLMRLYNCKAEAMGWRILKSPGTVGYHLQKAGLSRIYSKKTQNSPYKGRLFIKATTKFKKKIALKMGLTTHSVCDALKFKTNSSNAKEIRNEALKHGAKLYELKEVENPYRETITL